MSLSAGAGFRATCSPRLPNPLLPPTEGLTPKMADRPPTKHELHWFPFYVKDFMSSPDVLRMTDAEVGRYLRLLILAWGNGTKEPSLEPDDLTGASARVKKQFTERDGRLINRKLSDVWKVQRSKHDSAVKRGKKGGRPKARGKLSLGSAKAEGKAGSEANSKQDALVLRESIDSLPSSSVAELDAGRLAPDGPPPAIRDRRDGKGGESIGAILGRLIPRPA